MTDKAIVKAAYANIYSKPSFSSEMVTQALFFEHLEITSEHNNWFRVSQWDGYTGYVHKFYLSQSFEENTAFKKVLIEDRFQALYSSPDFSDNPVIIAPFGSEILVAEKNDFFITSKLDGTSFYLKSGPKKSCSNKRDQIIKNSKKLLGSPYLWGGKTPFGYDCSGFVQSIYKSIGLEIKRDTSLQISDKRMKSIELQDVDRGDLLFFSVDGTDVDHVGIWFGNNSVVHCGGELKIQPIDDASHTKLESCIVDIKSLSGFIDGV